MFYRLLLVLIFSLSLQAAEPVKVLVLGDSLTEGYGIPKEKAFPALLEGRLRKKHPGVKVVNGGISGSTSASGERRLRWHLKEKPAVMVLALGANDGLRGIDVKVTRENLAKVLRLARENAIKVVLAGMKLPPNYGETYRKEYEAMFASLAKEFGVPFLPFLLEGVGGERRFNLEDGIHPNEAGHAVIADRLYPLLERQL